MVGSLRIFCLSLIFLAVLGACNSNDDDLLRRELFADGHKYIVFGSQRTNGIELYDLEKKIFLDLLRPEANSVRYLSPVVDKSGNGFCIKEANTFDIKNKTSHIVSFDLTNLKIKEIYTQNIYYNYPHLALSPDDKKLAYISADGYAPELSTPYLIVFDLKYKKIVQRIRIDNKYFEFSTRLTWMPDGERLILWQAFMNAEIGAEVNTLTKEIKPSSSPFPFAYYDNKYSIADKLKNTTQLLLLNVQDKSSSVLADEAHAANFSFDGKYIVSAHLSGNGTIIRVTDVGNPKRKYDIGLHDFGTVLGLDIW